jgi:hypothetical protein
LTITLDVAMTLICSVSSRSNESSPPSRALEAAHFCEPGRSKELSGPLSMIGQMSYRRMDVPIGTWGVGVWGWRLGRGGMQA